MTDVLREARAYAFDTVATALRDEMPAMARFMNVPLDGETAAFIAEEVIFALDETDIAVIAAELDARSVTRLVTAAADWLAIVYFLTVAKHIGRAMGFAPEREPEVFRHITDRYLTAFYDTFRTPIVRLPPPAELAARALGKRDAHEALAMIETPGDRDAAPA